MVIARQHPGESVGSWLMEGFIRRLESMRISLAVQWIIVPMINVDGVVLGNNRTGVLGQDFNRNWNIDELAKKEKILTENNALLSLIKNIRRAHPKKLKIFIDFHGHSSQPNVFSYGPPHELNSENYYTGKLLPELIAKHSPFFNLEQCSAVIKADKKNTARSLLFNSFAVPFSYTIECSFGIMNGKQVGIDEFLSIGSDIATASMEFISNYLLKEKSTENSLELLEQIKLKYQERKDLIEEFDSDSEEPTRERKLE